MSTLTRRKRPVTRKKKLPQQSEKEKEEELLRKLERNRMAFEAWLDKKKEEDAVSHVLPHFSFGGNRTQKLEVWRSGIGARAESHYLLLSQPPALLLPIRG